MGSVGDRSRVPGIAAEMTSGAADTVTIEPPVLNTMSLQLNPATPRHSVGASSAREGREMFDAEFYQER